MPLNCQRLVEVERDDLVAAVLEHEVAERTDADLAPNRRRLIFRELVAATAFAHALRGLRLQRVDEVVRLNTETLAPRHLQVRLLRVLFADLDAEGLRGLGREGHHLIRVVNRLLRLGSMPEL